MKWTKPQQRGQQRKVEQLLGNRSRTAKGGMRILACSGMKNLCQTKNEKKTLLFFSLLAERSTGWVKYCKEHLLHTILGQLL
jgi:hypothetical protein